jgi:cell division protein FtsI (penicillin-binding protein 3)
VTQEERITLEGAAKAAMARTRSRLGFSIAAFGVVFAILFGRLVEVTMLREGQERKTARVETNVSYYRADIVDRNGEILATDLQAARLRDAQSGSGGDGAGAIGVLPTVDAVGLAAAGDAAGFCLITQYPPRQQEAVRQLGIPGLHFRDEPRRVYPNGRTAAHALGYVNVDNHGLAGVERGAEDLILERRNRGGVVELSLDLRVQHALQDELGRSTFGARGVGPCDGCEYGRGVGAMSLPDFDPNEPGGRRRRRFNNGRRYEMGRRSRRSRRRWRRCAEGDVRPQFATNPITTGRFTITDYHPENRLLTVPEIFVHSSNIGTAKMALEAARRRRRPISEDGC